MVPACLSRPTYTLPCACGVLSNEVEHALGSADYMNHRQPYTYPVSAVHQASSDVGMKHLQANTVDPRHWYHSQSPREHSCPCPGKPEHESCGGQYTPCMSCMHVPLPSTAHRSLAIHGLLRTPSALKKCCLAQSLGVSKSLLLYRPCIALVGASVEPHRPIFRYSLGRFMLG